MDCNPAKLNCEGKCSRFFLTLLHNIFARGDIGGQVLLDISSGCNIHHLVLAVDVFQDIIVLKDNDTCVTKLKKWIANDAGACDWKPDISSVMELEGKSDGDPAVKEEKLKKAMKQVLKFDPKRKNITSPVALQPVDGLITSGFLERTSKDTNEFFMRLKTIVALLKTNGKLILLGKINAADTKVRNDKMDILNMTEDEIRDSFLKAGLNIDVLEVEDRDASKGHHVSNNGRAIFVAAQKSK